MKSIFAQNLAALLAQEENKTEAAARMGVNRGQLNKYQNGKQKPSIDVVGRICKHYGVDERILSMPLAEILAERAELSMWRASQEKITWRQDRLLPAQS